MTELTPFDVILSSKKILTQKYFCGSGLINQSARLLVCIPIVRPHLTDRR